MLYHISILDITIRVYSDQCWQSSNNNMSFYSGCLHNYHRPTMQRGAEVIWTKLAPI